MDHSSKQGRNIYQNAVTGATSNPVMKEPDALDEDFAQAANRTLERSAELMRTLIPSHQSAIALVVEKDWTSVRKYFSLSEKYAAWKDYRVPAVGVGTHAWMLEHNAPARFTQAQLEAHPHWLGFGTEAGRHPPMRGWLTAPIRGRDGKNWGLLQLSDKCEGEYSEADEASLEQFAALVSETLEALWEVRNLRKGILTPSQTSANG